MGKYIFIGFLVITACLGAKEILDIPYAVNPPEIDGKVKDGEWDKALHWDRFYQTSPGDNTEPSERTEIFLTYDDRNLYIMFKFYFTDKNRIRNFHCSRDKIYTTDRMFFFFDTFHNNDMAYYIGCNMHGEQADGIVLDEIDPSIDLYYISKAEMTEYGFAAELKLPLESIKYKSGDNVEWGFFAKRHIPDGPEEIVPFKISRGGGNFYDNYAVIRFQHLPTKRNLKLIPSLTASYNIFEDKLLNIKDDDQDIEPELNIFYEPNSNITTTFTINPDFNIIEADGLEVDVNNRFPRFFQEKRPFFIEQSNPFYTDINIFHTRNIVDPLGGIKLSGSLGRNNLYILGALDENASGSRFGYNDKTDDVPFIFAGVSRKAADGNSFIRFASTFRKFSKYENYVLNIDGNKRFSEKVDADLQIATSFNEIVDETGNLIQEQGYAYAIDMDYYTGTWLINGELRGLTEEFQADLGYVPEVDKNFLSNRIEHQIHANTDQDLIRYMEFASTQNVKFTFDLKNIKSHYWEIMAGSNFKNSLSIWTGFEYQMENYLGKDFYMNYVWCNIGYEPVKQLKLDFLIVDGINLYFGEDQGEYGDFYKYETTVNLRPLSTFDIEFQHKYHETERKYIARTYEVKAKFQFHKNFWLRGIVQIIDNDLIALGEENRSVGLYPLFVYKPSSKTAIYLGATGNTYESEPLGQKEKLEDMIDTTYFLKMSYTLNIL
jgi:hypothetical protein